MNENEKSLGEYLKLQDYNSINDFLIEISRTPNEKDLIYIDALIDARELEHGKDYILNLVYYLGELGTNFILDDKYITFLKSVYFQSDRWVRNEILTAISKCADKKELREDILAIIRNAITDDYLPIKLNALKVINQIETLPEDILIRIILCLRSSNSEVISYSSHIIKNNIKSNQILINLLEKSIEESPKVNLTLIRNVLTNLFESVIKLETFREDLSESELSEDFKQKFFNEIQIMQRILLGSTNR